MGLIEFFGSLFFFVWFTSAIFWGIAATAFASKYRIDFKLAIPLGAIFQWLGLVILIIFYFVRKENNDQSPKFGQQDRFSANAPGSNPFMASDPFGNSSSNIFDAGISSSANEGVNFANNPFASPTQKRITRFSGWLNTLPGGFIIYGSIAVIAAFIWSLFLTWFNIVTPGRGADGINAFSTGFEFWVFITIGVIIAALIVALKRPALVSAVLLAMVGSWWLMLSTASLTARDVFVSGVDKLFQIPNLITSTEGYSETWAFDVGSAWYVLFFNSIILLVASCWLIAVAHRDRANASF